LVETTELPHARPARIAISIFRPAKRLRQIDFSAVTVSHVARRAAARQGEHVPAKLE